MKGGLKKYFCTAFLFILVSCQDIGSKKKLLHRFPVEGNLYLLEYEIPAKWPFDEALRAYYLTDSSRFRTFLGLYNDSTLPMCKRDYDSVYIDDERVLPDSIVILRRWGVDLSELRDRHKFD